MSCFHQYDDYKLMIVFVLVVLIIKIDYFCSHYLMIANQNMVVCIDDRVEIFVVL